MNLSYELKVRSYELKLTRYVLCLPTAGRRFALTRRLEWSRKSIKNWQNI